FLSDRRQQHARARRHGARAVDRQAARRGPRRPGLGGGCAGARDHVPLHAPAGHGRLMDELALLTKIEERLRVSDARVAIGVGDDAAVLAPMARGAVLSVDVTVEGVHFDRRWLSLEDAGFRGYVAAL